MYLLHTLLTYIRKEGLLIMKAYEIHVVTKFQLTFDSCRHRSFDRRNLMGMTAGPVNKYYMLVVRSWWWVKLSLIWPYFRSVQALVLVF